MGVYIKSMKMPNTCEECNLESFCDRWVDARRMCGKWESGVKATIRHPECPLVPIPPHGRLIDADALENEAQMRLLECNKYDNQFQKPYEVMRAIALAPTIISAEESE